jgi:lipoprotein-anchoring transpeptidase ErfK/SrfK
MSDYPLEERANVDVVPHAPRRSWRWAKWTLVALAVVVTLVALAGAAVAYATYDYAEQYRGRILPGTFVEGIDVGGMTPARALAAVRTKVGPKLDRRIEVTYRNRTWTTTPAKLGASSNAARVVRSAVEASAHTSWLDKARMRFLGEDVGYRGSVTVTYPHKGVRKFVAATAQRVDLEPRDASLDYSTGWVKITPERNGRRVQEAEARARLDRALRRGGPRITLPVQVLRPEVTSASFRKVLLVHIGENRLYLYERGKITHSWPVATGQPEYMTPTGQYEITEKRYMPTWINPAPTTWGADLPPEIPPGLANPLGLRALNWSAPAIRFHGTEATYSLGYNASHGCVRLSNDDVVELYDLVDVGTPIVSVIAGPLKPLYVSSPDPTPVAPPSGGKDAKGAANH